LRRAEHQAAAGTAGAAGWGRTRDQIFDAMRLVERTFDAEGRVHLGRFAAAIRASSGAGPDIVRTIVDAFVRFGRCRVRRGYLVYDPKAPIDLPAGSYYCDDNPPVPRSRPTK
jgi:hypothetical protein